VRRVAQNSGTSGLTRRALGIGLLVTGLAAACTTRLQNSVSRRRPRTGRVGPGADDPTAAPAPAKGGAATVHGRPDWVRVENDRRGNSAWGPGGWAIDDGQLAGPLEVAGFASRASVAAGEVVTFFVTTTAPSLTIAAFRVGWYSGAGARRVWSHSRIPGRVQPPPTVDAERTVRCAWSPTAQVSTAGWPPGTYLVLVEDEFGRRTYVPLTVRSPSVVGRLVLVNAVPTYQAYNQWGGYSLYKGPDGSFDTRAYQVSYDRPYDENGARILTQYEQAIITRAERLGLPWRT